MRIAICKTPVSVFGMTDSMGKLSVPSHKSSSTDYQVSMRSLFLVIDDKTSGITIFMTTPPYLLHTHMSQFCLTACCWQLGRETETSQYSP